MKSTPFHTLILSCKKVLPFIFSGILFCVLCSFFSAQTSAAVISTSNSGNWSNGANWSGAHVPPSSGDVVTINHSMIFDVNIPSANYTFNANCVSTTGSGNLNLSNGAVLDIKANVTINGTGNNLNGGTIYVRSGYTLTIYGIAQSGATIYVEEGATLHVIGNFLDNHGSIHVDGLISITGDYDGNAEDAVVDGNGDITTVGHMKTINNGTIFGVPNVDCSGNCSGRNLAGTGCNRPATISPSSTSSICAGQTVAFVASLGNPPTNPPVTITYQWQSRTSSSVFTDIPAATSSSYNASPVVTTSYRVKITTIYNSANCYSYSSYATVTVTACPRIWTGATSTTWETATNWTPALVPTQSDNVTIPAVTNLPLISTSVSAASVTIAAGASLTIASTGTLNAYGNITNNGTFTVNSGSTVAFKGSSAQTISGVGILYNMRVNNSGGVTISSPLVLNGTLSLPSGVLNTGNQLSINVANGGNIGFTTGDAGTVSGTLTLNRPVTSTNTHYIACPLNGVTANDLADDVEVINPSTNGTRLYVSNFATQGWTAVNDLNTTLAPGSAYSLFFPSTTTVDFTGTYTHGATYATPSYSNSSVKYIFMGNPYPCALDWSNAAGWTKTKIQDAIYFWNPLTKSYASYVGGVSVNGGTKYIPTMNSFFVATDGTGGNSSIVINNDSRNSTNATFWRLGEDPTIRLTVKGTASSDETVIRFNESATPSFDKDLDAYKFMNGTPTPSIYTTGGSESYSVNSLSDPYSSPSIPVHVKIPADGNYSLQIKNSEPSFVYTLIDKKLNTETIVTDSTYTFSALKIDNTDRFELVLKTSLTTGAQQSANANSLQLFSATSGFILSTDAYAGKTGSIDILDVTGRKIKSMENIALQNGSTYFQLDDVLSGSYLVKVVVDNNVFVDHITLVK